MTSPDTKPAKADASAVEVLRSNLLRYVGRAEDWAGSLPAKEAVKLRPSDWHAVCDTARALAAALQSSSSAEAELPPAEVATSISRDVERRYPSIKTALGSEYRDFIGDFWRAVRDCRSYFDRATAAEAERDALRAENDRLREALAFYGNEENWTSEEQVNRDEHFDTGLSFRNDQHGNRARSALNHGKGKG